MMLGIEDSSTSSHCHSHSHSHTHVANFCIIFPKKRTAWILTASGRIWRQLPSLIPSLGPSWLPLLLCVSPGQNFQVPSLSGRGDHAHLLTYAYVWLSPCFLWLLDFLVILSVGLAVFSGQDFTYIFDANFRKLSTLSIGHFVATLSFCHTSKDILDTLENKQFVDFSKQLSSI